MTLSAAELARLAAIAAALPPADAALLRQLIESTEPRQTRVRRRDEAIRATVAEHFPGRPCQAAKALASAWAAYAASGWRSERNLAALPESAAPRHAALHAITRLNDGRAMAWRNIVTIVANNPPRLQCERATVRA
jgi:hypothetical protein